MNLVIDGRSCTFEKGAMVLAVARENGIAIPSLCYHRKTGVAGRCRVCVVEVEGSATLQTACSLPAADGMRVHTRSEKVLETRRMVVNLLLSNGQHNCLSCEQNGCCELQDAAYELGIQVPAFVIDEPQPAKDLSSVMIQREPGKCIKCGRCVAACRSVVVNEVLDFDSRGDAAQVICDDGLPMGESSCVQCGECSQICPVGAIVDKKSVGNGRTWQLKKVDTTCPYCGVGCQVTAHVDEARNRIVKVTGREVLPNDGMLCVKGRYGFEFPSSPKRLTRPMLKKDGRHVEVSWDEALDFMATRIQAIVSTHGPDVFSAFGSGRVTNENNYAMAKFTRAVIKTNNIDHCART
jgi:predicted molibdopterin-dependent oxidoreductase YjgC